MKIAVGFSKSKGVISWGIRWFLGTEYNHTFFYIPDREMIFEADFAGVIGTNRDIWLENNDIVKQYELDVSEDRYIRISNSIDRLMGTPYGKWQIVKILFHSRFSKQNKDSKLICSEFIMSILSISYNFFVEKQDNINPRDVDFFMLKTFYYGYISNTVYP